MYDYYCDCQCAYLATTLADIWLRCRGPESSMARQWQVELSTHLPTRLPMGPSPSGGFEEPFWVGRGSVVRGAAADETKGDAEDLRSRRGA
eukprot:9356689-Alexandrium_andersonii.AAC.1